jgi:RNA polymerase sigma factor (TIGR02999 family)
LALRGQQPGNSLQATELVNEAYLRLCGREWVDRHHFLAVAAHAMRSVIIDHVRAKGSQKRTPPGERRLLEEITDAHEARSLDLLALDEVLEKLATFDARAVRFVELRTFAELPMVEAAAVLGLSLRTAEREWQTLCAWLYKELS